MLDETVEIAADEENELTFKVVIEGHVSGPARVRLVCEGSEVSYVFAGSPVGQEGLVNFTVPRSLKLAEGDYPSQVEVLVDGRHFVPVKFNTRVKRAVTVQAEAVQLPKPVKKQPEIRVAATPVVATERPPLRSNTVLIEGPQKTLQTKDEVSTVKQEVTLKGRWKARKGGDK